MPLVANKPPMTVSYDLWSHPVFSWNGGRSDSLPEAREYAVRHGFSGIRLVKNDPDGPERVNRINSETERSSSLVDVLGTP